MGIKSAVIKIQWSRIVSNDNNSQTQDHFNLHLRPSNNKGEMALSVLSATEVFLVNIGHADISVCGMQGFGIYTLCRSLCCCCNVSLPSKVNMYPFLPLHRRPLSFLKFNDRDYSVITWLLKNLNKHAFACGMCGLITNFFFL